MRAYLLVFDDSDISRKEVIWAVDRMVEIKNWHAFFGNALCIASEESAKALATRINRALPQLRYLIAAVEPDQKGGRMPKSVLGFLNEPRPVETELT